MLHFWTDDKINISSVHNWKESIDETNAEYFSSQTENVFCNMGYRNYVFIYIFLQFLFSWRQSIIRNKSVEFQKIPKVK